MLSAALRGARRRAVAIGLGTAGGDATLAALALAGIGGLVAAQPGVPTVLRVVSATTLIVYGGALLRRPRQIAGPGARAAGFAVGLALVLANPAALMAWVLVLGVVEPPAAWVDAVVLVAGVAAGSAAGYAAIAWAPAVLGAHAQRVRAVAAGALVAGGVGSLVSVAAWGG